MITAINMFSVFYAFQKQDASSKQQEMWIDKIYENLNIGLMFLLFVMFIWTLTDNASG